MKQKLKISIGSSLQKAATCLTVAAVIATLGLTGHESDTILRTFWDTYKIPNNYYQYMPTSPVVHLSNQ